VPTCLVHWSGRSDVHPPTDYQPLQSLRLVACPPGRLQDKALKKRHSRREAAPGGPAACSQRREVPP
jgi:hypothetical protein